MRPLRPISPILLLSLLCVLLRPTLLPACGLDWTLPHAHFDGVDEQGHVSYWETLGQADLGDNLTIPIHIGFNSSRQASSPTLGKGWILPLLESHIEPVDENTMHVIMPDGWTFHFLRNDNTETWRGNAGWIGQTDGTRFTITAPCGWRLKYDLGKIQEIDTPTNRTITIKYNGPAATEADIDNKPFLQVDPNPTTGIPQSLTINDQKILLTQAPRPRINTIRGQTLLTGFDPSLSQLQYPNGQKETFDFAVPQNLSPTLIIAQPNCSPRTITWDSGAQQITTDGEWTYNLVPGNTAIERINVQGKRESYFKNPLTGVTVTRNSEGVTKTISSFVGVSRLAGKVRMITEAEDGAAPKIIHYAYSEEGLLLRVTNNSMQSINFDYDEAGRITAVYDNGAEVWKASPKAGNGL